jgi:hypothetical protein
LHVLASVIDAVVNAEYGEIARVEICCVLRLQVFLDLIVPSSEEKVLIANPNEMYDGDGGEQPYLISASLKAFFHSAPLMFCLFSTLSCCAFA